MKIRKIEIKNFRMVKVLDWNLPKADVFCLIGKGDSSKSIILEVIRYTTASDDTVAVFLYCGFMLLTGPFAKRKILSNVGLHSSDVPPHLSLESNPT